jgi:hypothetical protein
MPGDPRREVLEGQCCILAGQRSFQTIPGGEIMSVDYLKVCWLDPEIAGSTDIIPVEFLDLENRTTLIHRIDGPRGGRAATALCDVVPGPDFVDFDYRSYEAQNRSGGAIPGLMRVVFGAGEQPSVYWRGTADQELEPANVKVVWSSEQARDLAELRGRPTTQRAALTQARVGQGRFREEVLERWQRRCAVTGCVTPELLRASHIKPWRASSDQERLSSHNGLALAAHIDALFDKHLVSFQNDGTILLAAGLIREDAERLNLVEARLSRPLEGLEAAFMAEHRELCRL